VHSRIDIFGITNVALASTMIGRRKFCSISRETLD